MHESGGVFLRGNFDESFVGYFWGLFLVIIFAYICVKMCILQEYFQSMIRIMNLDGHDLNSPRNSVSLASIQWNTASDLLCMLARLQAVGSPDRGVQHPLVLHSFTAFYQNVAQLHFHQDHTWLQARRSIVIMVASKNIFRRNSYV